MTNKEALIAVVQVSVDDNVLEKALLDQNLELDDEYDSGLATTINKAAIDVLEGLLSRPNVTEGGFSETFDRGAIQARLTVLYNKVGVTQSTTPVVKSGTHLW
jgi:hypothetical protein